MKEVVLDDEQLYFIETYRRRRVNRKKDYKPLQARTVYTLTEEEFRVLQRMSRPGSKPKMGVLSLTESFWDALEDRRDLKVVAKNFLTRQRARWSGDNLDVQRTKFNKELEVVVAALRRLPISKYEEDQIINACIQQVSA